jgi:hypothetical protein
MQALDHAIQLRIVCAGSSAYQLPQIVVFQFQKSLESGFRLLVQFLTLRSVLPFPKALKNDIEFQQSPPAVPAQPPMTGMASLINLHFRPLA